MKKSIKLFGIFAVIAMLFIVSCGKEKNANPVAGFTISPNDTLIGGQTFTFTNTSTDADTYLWNFGDGSTSTAVSPTKSMFAVSEPVCEQPFTITLTATKNGKSSTISKNVVVLYCR